MGAGHSKKQCNGNALTDIAYAYATKSQNSNETQLVLPLFTLRKIKYPQRVHMKIAYYAIIGVL